MISSKDRLLSQARRVISAFTPEKFSTRFFHVCTVFNNKCGKFIIGKIIDSSIIGLMCFIGMSIFRFDYPLLISVIIGVSNLIPFFGPFIGGIPSAVLLLLINPMEALWFVIFLFVLQQFDGNILGPKILGESVGISGFWIMVSVIVGGGLVGCETALWLAQEGKKVTIVEALDKIMAVNGPLCHANKDMLERLLPFNNVDIICSARVTGYQDGKLSISLADGDQQIPCDSVILSVGYRECDSLYHELEFDVPEIYLLGDAKKVANIMYAIWDSFEVANHI